MLLTSSWAVPFGEEIEELWPDWPDTPLDLGYPIPDLLNDENFNDWRCAVQQNLGELGIRGFIEGTERPPEWSPKDANLIKRANYNCFGRRRYRAFRIIYDSIKPILWELQTRRLWSIEEDFVFRVDKHDPSVDPKGLWDAIVRWNTDVPYDIKCRYLKELSNIHRDQFPSLDKYLQRACWLHMRLRAISLAIPEDVQMSFVINGLAFYNAGFAMIMRRSLNDGSLTFHELINDIRRIEPDFERLYKRQNRDHNSSQSTEKPRNNKNGRNNKQRRNNAGRRNNQGHRQQHNGVTKR